MTEKAALYTVEKLKSPLSVFSNQNAEVLFHFSISVNIFFMFTTLMPGTKRIEKHDGLFSSVYTYWITLFSVFFS